MKTKNTPLHLAAWEGHLDVVEFLIENGAKIDSKNLNFWFFIIIVLLSIGQLKMDT